VYEFRDKKAKQHLGGIYDFLLKKKMDSMKELEKKDVPLAQKIEVQKVDDSDKLSFEERKEINKNISRLEKSVEKAEQDISALEGKIADMDKMLENADGTDPEIFKKYDRLKKELEQKMYEWEILQEELEEIVKKKTW
jgi:ATP-binding cassette subfamily F protein 3